MSNELASQGEVVRFLGHPATHGPDVAAVERRETHGAWIFLGGDHAWKIKRAVRFDYMDFSTLARRHAVLERELAVNRANAPDLYLDVIPVTRTPAGTLALGGDGQPIEWVLRMRRFDEAQLLGAIAARGPLGDDLVKSLAGAIVASHAAAPPHPGPGGADRIAHLIDGLDRSLATMPPHLATESIAGFVDLARSRHQALEPLLDRRGRAGLVRRCHGDLHLDNIVLWQGRPTLFDALEFDERLATTDTLYDLAFLLMDLGHAGQRPAADLLLNRYLWATDRVLDLEGLAALPLFLALRAGVRALVRAQHAAQLAAASPDQAVSEDAVARCYLAEAVSALSPPPPRLIVVGGFSGTGKSTLAARLAPDLGAAPGALHLRSDLERKTMLGVAETERLPERHYARGTGERVYRRLEHKARVALAAGHAVVVDAVFADADARRQFELLAGAAGVPFMGLWLDAPRDKLLARVAARRGDASDADAAVVERQIAAGPGPLDWTLIDAAGSPEQTLAHARSALGIAQNTNSGPST